MIEKIIEFSIKHRWLVLVCAAGLVVGGFCAIHQTPTDAIPDLSENQLIIFTDWMGHNPQEIEDQVTYPLSLHLQGMAGVRALRSDSELNFSMIHMIFQDGVDVAGARREVAERLADAAGELPVGVTPRLAPDAPATGQILWYTVEGAGFDLGKLRAIQDWYVRPQLRAVPGVAEVASVGGRAAEYEIEIDPDKLRACQLTVSDVTDAVAQANATIGGNVIEKGDAEYIVRSVGGLGHSAPTAGGGIHRDVWRHLEDVIVPAADGSVRLGDIARVSMGPQPRRGVLEKDGNEVTGGVVLLRRGENPLEVTRRVRDKIQALQDSLPAGVHLVAMYDRTPLIRRAIHTITGTLMEAMLTAAVCVVLVLRHWRTAFVIVCTLPLAVLASFVMMWLLRNLGIVDVQTNVMSLAGIAISIGVLVDSSMVMAENALFHLHRQFGSTPVRGDVRAIVLPACRMVGRPIFFSVLIMLLSFLPVFALGGMEGRMFGPLAFTKCFALIAVAVLAITLVPALCTILIKGRLRSERDSWLVRSVTEVYRPMLAYFLANPAPLLWFLAGTVLLGAGLSRNYLASWLGAAVSRAIFLALLCGMLAICAGFARTWRGRMGVLVSLILWALVVDRNLRPIESGPMVPLDEGVIMDMPISWPRASLRQSADDLKARDMIFCRFPEVHMVMGKAGRAETAMDPAPVNMIETMIDFRPPEHWSRRKLQPADATRQVGLIIDQLVQQDLIEPPADPSARQALVEKVVSAVLPSFDALMREYCYATNRDFESGLQPTLLARLVEHLGDQMVANGSLDEPLTVEEVAELCRVLQPHATTEFAAEPTPDGVARLARAAGRHLMATRHVRSADPYRYQRTLLNTLTSGWDALLGQAWPSFFTRVYEDVLADHRRLWGEHIRRLDALLIERAAGTFTRLAIEDVFFRSAVKDSKIAAGLVELKRLRTGGAQTHEGHHHDLGMKMSGRTPSLVFDPIAAIDPLQTELTQRFARRLLLWRKERADLIGQGGELDRVMQMPGWVNVWTMPIQNRVDMLATGVNTQVGVRVLGHNLEDVVAASEKIASVLKGIRGAVGVVADPVRGRGYLDIRPRPDRAGQLGVSAADMNALVETALGGKVVTTSVENRERYPVRVRFSRDSRRDEETIRRLLVPVHGRSTGVNGKTADGTAKLSFVPLSEVADVMIRAGPANIKSENGLLRNYVYLNVQGRDVEEFVSEARRLVTEQVHLPQGVQVEWTGQFEHEVHARNTLVVIVPIVILSIFGVLYWTYHDLADALLMLLAVPGALAGGILCQWLFGYKFSVTLWIGYIACFGMVTSTGIIMLVYLRDAITQAGGLGRISLHQLREAVMAGAVQRLRPKLLTECTTVIGLAPLLWATGTGAEIIKPMVVPVLGGLLMADEVIDLLLPVLFYHVRRRRWERLHRSGSLVGSVEASLHQQPEIVSGAAQHMH